MTTDDLIDAVRQSLAARSEYLFEYEDQWTSWRYLQAGTGEKTPAIYHASIWDKPGVPMKSTDIFGFRRSDEKPLYNKPRNQLSFNLQ